MQPSIAIFSLFNNPTPVKPRIELPWRRVEWFCNH